MKCFSNYCINREVSLQELTEAIPLTDEQNLDYLLGCSNTIQALVDLGLIKVVYRDERN